MTTKPTPIKSGYVEANGLNYYYEVHGQGEPLLLLHGGLGSVDMFGPLLPKLAASRQVIGVDMHGHGRTALGDRALDLIDMGNDMARILDQLGYEQVDAMGYSLGGSVAFRLAVQHPTKVRRLVLASIGFAKDGFYPELIPLQEQMTASTAEMMKESPVYKSYQAIAPHPEDFPKLVGSIGDFMRKSYDWTEDVTKLTMPVMLVYGDSDAYRPEHIVKFYQLLGGWQRDPGWMQENMPKNRLAVLPGRTHYDLFAAPEMVNAVLPFLNGTTGSASPSEPVDKQNT